MDYVALGQIGLDWIGVEPSWLSLDCDGFDIDWIAMIWKGLYWIAFGLDLIGGRLQ